MKSICVFCGSNLGNGSIFVQTAQSLGTALAEQNITLVYGGSNVGLMGAVADAALKKGGSVIGVLPRFLQQKEIAHPGLSELILCETMHERKKKMFELSQGFMALPGGFGTLEEIIEILTWRQLGLHEFPIAFLNVQGFYDSLLQQFNRMESSDFLSTKNKRMAIFESDIPTLIQKMKNSK